LATADAALQTSGFAGNCSVSCPSISVAVYGSEQAELTVERGAIVLRKPHGAARLGWAEAAEAVAAQGEDELLMGEFANAGDLELEW
jgi:antitoxin MazE